MAAVHLSLKEVCYGQGWVWGSTVIESLYHNVMTILGAENNPMRYCLRHLISDPLFLILVALRVTSAKSQPLFVRAVVGSHSLQIIANKDPKFFWTTGCPTRGNWRKLGTTKIWTWDDAWLGSNPWKLGCLTTIGKPQDQKRENTKEPCKRGGNMGWMSKQKAVSDMCVLLRRFMSHDWPHLLLPFESKKKRSFMFC